MTTTAPTTPAATAQDLLLLLLEDGRRRGLPSRTLETVIGGALLLDLLATGHLEFAADGVLAYRRRVVATGAEPGEDLRRRAVRLVTGPTGAGLPAVTAVERLGSALSGAVLDRLAAAGVAEHRRERVLGLLRRDRWVLTHPARARAVRERLRAVLTGAADPTPQDAVALTVLAESGRGFPLDGLGWSARRGAVAAARELTAAVPGRAALRVAVLAAAG
ncbi:GOLPH3/VPS74 family protein [Kineococcus sp. SYSU DK003]|uniref:GOLPH3/VPS74 family protein n=1 Tax=Kineococcus sp. SYSU DK003 TaxID=3383124 RepID=UPI003D7CBF41